ncbi:metallophosphoesterase [bacterium]|nr:metallophosphoesterase [bacterium]
MFNSYLWLKQIDLNMSENWTLSRRRFLGIAGTTAAGLMLSPGLFAKGNEKPLIRFGMISDVHYANREPAGNRFYNQSLTKVQEAIDRMNQEKLDFLIELGDFKDQDAVPNEANTLKYLIDIESVFQKFNGSTYHVLGNHDMDGISKQQFLERVENTGISSAKSYYSFDQKGIHFVVLDGNFTKEGKAYDHGNFSWDDASISEEEVGWLKADLNSNQLPTIIFIHQMLDDSKNVKQAVQNAAEVRQILEQSGNVLCVLQGHVHEERYNHINGIHYFSVNAVIDGDGPENSAYMIIDIYKDQSLKIDGFRRASDRGTNN